MFLKAFACLLLLGQSAWSMPGGGAGMPGMPPGAGQNAASSNAANTNQAQGSSNTIGGQSGFPPAGGASSGAKTKTTSGGAPASGPSAPKTAQAKLTGAAGQTQTKQNKLTNAVNQQMQASNTIGGGGMPPMGGPMGGQLSSKCPKCPKVNNADYTCKNEIQDETKYQCKPNYEDNGEGSKITCGMNGKWIPDPFKFKCSPMQCTGTISVKNAAVVGSSSCAVGKMITFKCNKGYKGTKTDLSVECGTDKKWITPSFTCKKIDCGSQPSLANAGTNTAATAHGTTLKYKCNTGYWMNNGHEIACADDGQWAPAIGNMMCQMVTCKKPTGTQLPANADMVAGNGFPKWNGVMKYKCKTGYVSNGVKDTMTCQASGDWSPTLDDMSTIFKCKRPGCSAPSSVSNGKHDGSKSSFNHGDSVSYSCDVGYTLSGRAASNCYRGRWSAAPTCKVVNCPNLKNTNANFDVDKSSSFSQYLSKVTYKCKSGYKSNGANGIITCQSSGQWSPSEQSVHDGLKCTQKQCPATAPSVSNASPSMRSRTVGSKVSYSCDKYYEGSGNKVISCLSNEQWQTTTFSCTLKKCGVAPAMSNAAPSVTTSVSHGGSVTYTCKSGYRMLTAATNVAAIKCVGDAWDKTPSFTCQSTSCDASLIPTVDNSDRKPTTASGKLSHGTQIAYNCKKGHYGTSSDHTIKCVNAKWTKPSIQCIAITCEGVPEIQNAHAQNPNQKSIFNIGDILKYFCNQGKVSNGGVNQVDCKVNDGSKQGKWSKTSFKCLNPSPCTAPPTVANAKTKPAGNSFQHDETVAYACNDCYKVKQGSTSKVATCNNGKWQGPKMSCSKISCAADPVPAATVAAQNYKLISKSDDSYCGSKAKYTCKTGYRATNADNEVECEKSGKWTNLKLKCTVITCGAVTLANASPSTTATTHGTVVKFTCNTGYTLTNNQELTCGTNGQWTNHAMVCKETKCSAPPTVAHTTVSTTATSFSTGDSVTFTCTSGYTGTGTATCHKGTWSKPNVNCVSTSCATPPTIANTQRSPAGTVFAHGSKVTYKCTGDYVGSGFVTCQNTKWSTHNVVCKNSNCGTPTKLTNANHNGGSATSFKDGKSIKYTCVSGMSGGPAYSTCKSGTWSQASITCKSSLIKSITLFTDPWDCSAYGSKAHLNKAKLVMKGEKGSCFAYMTDIKHNYKQTLYLGSSSSFCKKDIGKLKTVTISHETGYGFRFNMIYICDSGACSTFRCGYRKNPADAWSSCVMNNNKNRWGALKYVKKSEWGTSGYTLNATQADANLHVVYTWTSPQYGAETKGVYLIRFIDESGKKTGQFTMNPQGVPLYAWNCACQNYYLRYSYYYQTREPRCAEIKSYKRWGRTYKYYTNSKKSVAVPIQAFYFNLPSGFKLKSIEITADKDKKKYGSRYYGYNDGWYFHGVNVMNLKNQRWNFACGVNKNHRFCALDADLSYNFAMKTVTMHNIPSTDISYQRVAGVTTYTSGSTSHECNNNIELTFTDSKGNTCTVKSFNGQTTATRKLVRSRTQDFHIICQKSMSAVTKVTVKNTKDNNKYDTWSFYKICITPNIRYAKEYCFACGTYYGPCKVDNLPVTVPEKKYTTTFKIRTITHPRYGFHKCYSAIQVDMTDYNGVKCTDTMLNKNRYKRMSTLSGTQYWYVTCVTKGKPMGKMRYVKFSNRRTYRKPYGRWFMYYVTFYSKHPSHKRYGHQRIVTKSFKSSYVYYYIYYSTFTLAL